MASEILNIETNYNRLRSRDLLTAGLSMLAALVLYILTLTPSVSAGDNGELTTAMQFLGIAHAPGYPLHSFMGKLFTFLPFYNVGWRANFFSAFCGALTIYFAVLVYIKLLINMGVRRTYALAAAVLTALAFMFSDTLWSQAIMCEVYTMSAVFYPAMILILLRWRDDIAEHRGSKYPYFGERYLLAYAFLFGTAMCGHQTILATAPFGFAYIVLVLVKYTARGRSLSKIQVFNGVLFLVFQVIVLFIAYYIYYIYIMKRESSSYVRSNNVIGLGWFVTLNGLLVLVWLYFKFIADDKVDPCNYLQKAFFSVVKMLLCFYLGFSINMYMFVRSHGEPHINWVGINETNYLWLKFGKLFHSIWRKQFPPTRGLTLMEFSEALKALITRIHYDQYSLPLYLLALLGMVKLFVAKRTWFYMVIWSLLTYNISMILFLAFNTNGREIFFVKVFFIFSYFIVSIPICAGIAWLMEGVGRVVVRRSRSDDQDGITPQSPPPSSTPS